MIGTPTAGHDRQQLFLLLRIVRAGKLFLKMDSNWTLRPSPIILTQI